MTYKEARLGRGKVSEVRQDLWIGRRALSPNSRRHFSPQHTSRLLSSFPGPHLSRERSFQDASFLRHRGPLGWSRYITKGGGMVAIAGTAALFSALLHDDYHAHHALVVTFELSSSR